MMLSTLEVRKLLLRGVKHLGQGQQAPKSRNQNQNPGCQTSKPPPFPTNMSVWSKEKSKFLTPKREERRPDCFNSQKIPRLISEKLGEGSW